VLAAVGDVHPASTLIVQPDALCREGLSRIIREYGDLQLTAVAASAAEALGLVQLHRPALILTEVDIPAEDGLGWIATLSSMAPAPRVIVLSRQGGHAYVLAAIAEGARGYLLRNSSPAELREAIRRVLAGQLYVHPSLAGRLIEHRLGPERSLDLTERECAVLIRLAHGSTNDEIARALFISEKTVRNTLSRLFQKLNVHNRTAAVAAGRYLGYL